MRPDPPIAELEALLRAKPALRVIALVEPSDAAHAQLAPLIQRELIYDYHTLPLDLDRLLVTLGHISGLVTIERSAGSQVRPLPGQGTAMVGTSPAMLAVHAAIDKIARSEASALIQGESGTGKELVARAIHERSRRARGPFVALNCAALPPSLIGSELFGHEKGAFTGAVVRKIGRIEAANGGSLFLDEIGDLPLELQGHFLRFLQERTIDRVGGTSPIEVDVRVIAATNIDLAKAQAEGRFREDLFYRVNVLTIELPPLSRRGNDIELLARYYLERFARELRRPMLGFRDSALRAMRAYAWPGNVRELISCTQRAAVMAEGRWVTIADLGLDEHRAVAAGPADAARGPLGSRAPDGARGARAERPLRAGCRAPARRLADDLVPPARALRRRRAAAGCKADRCWYRSYGIGRPHGGAVLRFRCCCGRCCCRGGGPCHSSCCDRCRGACRRSCRGPYPSPCRHS